MSSSTDSFSSQLYGWYINKNQRKKPEPCKTQPGLHFSHDIYTVTHNRIQTDHAVPAWNKASKEIKIKSPTEDND